MRLLNQPSPGAANLTITSIDALYAAFVFRLLRDVSMALNPIHRNTGRTFRTILRAALAVSEGRNVIVKGHSDQNTEYLSREVAKLLKTYGALKDIDPKTKAATCVNGAWVRRWTVGCEQGLPPDVEVLEDGA